MISKMNIEKLKNDKTNLFLDLEMPKDSCLGSLKKAYEKEDYQKLITPNLFCRHDRTTQF